MNLPTGLGHIKLWKMANTFTGLKLQGRLGRFGKTEISDINGFLQLPDGKVTCSHITRTQVCFQIIFYAPILNLD